MPTEGANNFGTQGARISEIAKAKWYSGIEGAPISRFANRIPGINAVAGLHDVFQINLGPSNGFWRNVLNFPGMPVAEGITFAGMASGVPSAFLDDRIYNKKYEGLENQPPDRRNFVPLLMR